MITTAAEIYLSVSMVSLTVQTISLVRILRRPAVVRLARRGLTRTAMCRVAASTTYVALGVAALFNGPAAGRAAFIALIVIQGLWVGNGLLDSRLSGRLAAVRVPNKHEA